MKRLVIGVVALGVVVVAAVVIYVQVIKDEAPPRLALSDDVSAPGGDETVETDGTWETTAAAVVGYRVVEDFIEGLQNSEAAGRTSEVSGSLTIEGTTVPQATFTVDMTTLESDDAMRDGQVSSRILDTEQFPESTFTLTEPITFGAVPEPGVEITAEATGELELRGVTNEITFDVTAKIVGGELEVLATIPIEFADYEIPDASNPVSDVRDNGEIEVLLVLAPAAG